MRVTPDRVEAMLDDLARLVRAESPSDDLVAVADSAGVVADIMTARLGRAPEVVSVDGVHHVMLRGRDPRVLVLGHHDTVWPIGTLAELPFRVADGVITGPGTLDMKVGLVQAIHALDLVRAEIGLDAVTLLVTGDEEVGSPTSRALIEAEAARCDAALVLEPGGGGGELKVARKGTSNYRIEVEGRAAHAGLEPERGVNAGIALAGIVLALDAIADADAGTTVTPTTLAGGTTANTVPARAHVQVDVRARTVGEQQRVDRAIRALTTPVSGARITVTGGPHRPPLERSATNGLFERARALADVLGQPESVGIAVGGASDGNFTGALGVPTLDGLGAVGGGPHAPDEHALVGWIAPRTELLAALVVDVVTRARPAPSRTA